MILQACHAAPFLSMAADAFHPARMDVIPDSPLQAMGGIISALYGSGTRNCPDTTGIGRDTEHLVALGRLPFVQIFREFGLSGPPGETEN